jgi:uncharacterized protein (TIGR03000 family)
MRNHILLGTLVSSFVLLTAANSAQAPLPSGITTQAQIRVLVPSPDASLWFDDTPTRQKGACRLFVSPPLDAGETYTYPIKTAWLERARTVIAEKQVKVHSGQETVVDFTERRSERTGQPARPGPEAYEDRPLTPRIAPEPAREGVSADRPLTSRKPDREAPSADRPLTPPIAP